MNNPKNLCLTISLFCISFIAYSQQLVKPLVEPESGDVYSPDYRYGVVLTSPDGSCYRIRVLNGGTVFTENIACPDDMDFCPTTFDCNGSNPVINNGNPVTCNTIVPITINWVDCNNELITLPNEQVLTASIGQIQYQSTNGITNSYSWTIPATGSSSQQVTFSYGDPDDLCTFLTTIPACENPPDGFCDVPLGPLKAAPNLEGYGVTTQAGRGGEVRIVTNTNDSGPGSFRTAVSGNTPKIVIFNVSGKVVAENTIFIGNNTSIYGQCAPGPFELNSHPILMGVGNILLQVGSDVLIQHIRSRTGPADVATSSWDAIQCHQSSRVVIDHCDFAWSEDEIVDIGASTDITISNCLIHEALRFQNKENPFDSNISNGAHDKGVLIWNGSKRVTLVKNLMYGFNDRAPQFEADLCQSINNVAYQIGSKKFPHLVHGNFTPGTFRFRVENNLAIDSGSDNMGICISDLNTYPTANFEVYYANNVHQFGNGPIVPTAYPTSATNSGYCSGGIPDAPNFDFTVFQVNSDPTNSPPIEVLPTASLENYVLQHAGATAHRDASHNRVKNLLVTRTGIPAIDCVDGMYVQSNNFNCASSVPSTQITPINGNPKIDLNAIDGVPSAWKIACGLDPNANTTQIEPYGDGWTAFEFYIYGMTPK